MGDCDGRIMVVGGEGSRRLRVMMKRKREDVYSRLI